MNEKMNTKKAIELLKQDLNDPGSVAIEDLIEAQKLAIKALEYLYHLAGV